MEEASKPSVERKFNEFGEQLINDPGFYQMVDGIQMQMESNAEIAAIMQQAIAKLLGGAAPDSTT